MAFGTNLPGSGVIQQLTVATKGPSPNADDGRMRCREGDQEAQCNDYQRKKVRHSGREGKTAHGQGYGHDHDHNQTEK